MADPTDIRSKVIAVVKEKPCSVSELSRILKVRREFMSGYLEALRHIGELRLMTIGMSKVYTPTERSKK